MDYLLICTVAFLASGLTLCSGFGLGNRFIARVTLAAVQYLVAVWLVLIAAALGLGLM